MHYTSSYASLRSKLAKSEPCKKASWHLSSYKESIPQSHYPEGSLKHRTSNDTPRHSHLSTTRKKSSKGYKQLRFCGASLTLRHIAQPDYTFFHMICRLLLVRTMYLLCVCPNIAFCPFFWRLGMVVTSEPAFPGVTFSHCFLHTST